MNRFECYIGSLDLSPYIRAIDFEEAQPEMLRYWNSHSKIFFRRKVYKAVMLQSIAPM